MTTNWTLIWNLVQQGNFERTADILKDASTDEIWIYSEHAENLMVLLKTVLEEREDDANQSGSSNRNPLSLRAGAPRGTPN
jgi:hypothetical protein